uniref:Transmembrane protein 144 n=1 Tax=Schistocephalus solidus TaxID=70667 RepID=A0A0X3PU01_SCHSO
MNSTTNPSTGLYSPAAGYGALVISVLGFGIYYIPVKKFNMGDGMFFQWVMGTAIMFVSLIVNCAVGSPQFYPLAMVGGALWGTGNALMITVIDAIGVGLGMLIASVANMLCGFASSRFGWFDIPAKIPSNPIMNYVGVGIAVGSVLIYAAIKPNRKEENEEEISTDEEHDNMSDRVIMSLKEIESESALVDELDPEVNKGCSRGCKPVSQLPMVQRRIIGIILAICTGVLFGNIFVPTLYIQGHYENASQNGLDYVFAVCAGVWVASTVIFIIYTCAMCNQPWVPAPGAILPALGSGIVWAIAETAWSVSNTSLGEPITFPIVTTVPALIATLCGLIFFKEIVGLRNYILLAVAFCVTTAGVILNALSR